MSAALLVTGNRNVVLFLTWSVNGVTSSLRSVLLYWIARSVPLGRAGNTTPDWPMISWHCSPERNLTHLAALSGCLDSVVMESARPLNIEARLPDGPIGVGAMPMSSFLPAASVSLLNVEIVQDPPSAIAAAPDWICLSGLIALLPPISAYVGMKPFWANPKYHFTVSWKAGWSRLKWVPHGFLSVACQPALPVNADHCVCPQPLPPDPSEPRPWTLTCALSKPGSSPRLPFWSTVRCATSFSKVPPSVGFQFRVCSCDGSTPAALSAPVL